MLPYRGKIPRGDTESDIPFSSLFFSFSSLPLQRGQANLNQFSGNPSRLNEPQLAHNEMFRGFLSIVVEERDVNQSLISFGDGEGYSLRIWLYRSLSLSQFSILKRKEFQGFVLLSKNSKELCLPFNWDKWNFQIIIVLSFWVNEREKRERKDKNMIRWWRWTKGGKLKNWLRLIRRQTNGNSPNENDSTRDRGCDINRLPSLPPPLPITKFPRPVLIGCKSRVAVR